MNTNNANSKLESKRILVLDDEELLGWCICHELMKLGYDVQLADNLQSGKEALTVFMPHLIVCDQNFPEGDCLDTITQWHLPLKQIETIFITAYTPPSSKDMARVGAKVCLSKPFEMKTLVSAIENHFLT